jgi:uncharacterized phage-associated protein
MPKFTRVNTTALDAANYILNLAEEDGVPMDAITLQKILFHCQCWSLSDGQRLFDEPVEAWKHGPVVRSVWKAYSGSGNIRRSDDPRFYELAPDQMDLIQGVWQTLKNIHGFTLSKKTHEPGSAWSKARGGLPPTADSDRPIDLADMAEEAARVQRETQKALLASWDDLVRWQT